MTEPSMKLTKITPKLAAEMLAHNVRNRRSQRVTVSHYARQMTEGLWEVNGDAIRFAEDGTLLDGQHRLAAIVQSGMTIESWVGRGFTMDAQKTMDQQRKRTAGDILGMYGIAAGNRVAAIVRMVNRWEGGERSIYGFTGSQAMLSAAEVLDIAQKDEIYEESAKVQNHPDLHAMAQGRVLGSLFVLTSRVDVDLCEHFFDRLASGAGLAENDPILTLRRYWTRAKSTRSQAAVGITLMAGVRAWNALAEGRQLQQISWKSNDIPELSKVDWPTVDALRNSEVSG